jgi:hypothetical protein
MFFAPYNFYRAESRPIIRSLRKAKIALSSKVKIIQRLVKHLSSKMCCKPASFSPPQLLIRWRLTLNQNWIKPFYIIATEVLIIA